jgi:choline dehydrogenase-like flavoprotein
MGGSSSMNAMMFAAGHKQFYDEMGKSNKGWSYSDVQPCK